MKIALATDHAGFEKMVEVKHHLMGLSFEYVDYGPVSLNPDDDYPAFMFSAAQAVANNECDLGIILGGSGQGEAMAANRVNGVRCAVFYGPQIPKAAIDNEGHTTDDPYEILKLSKLHNNANMLSLAARFLSLEEIWQALDIWLNTSFSNIERHKRRIEQLDNQ
jgi:ribose 5-phosphate isomerase B